MRADTLLAFGLAATLAATGCSEPYATFGEPMQLTAGDAIEVGRLLREKEAFNGQRVLVTGTVREVCVHKGCWITMGDAGSNETVFVKFTCPLEGRLVPVNAVGHQATVEGTLTVEEVTEEEARHTAEDGGASPDDIAKIVGPQKRIRIAAPSAKIMGLKQPATGA